MKDFDRKMRDRHWQREDRRLEQKGIKRFRKEIERFCALNSAPHPTEKVEVQRYVHMAFAYACKICGEHRLMWIEKGLEEACNPMLKEKSGLPHKPTPFAIRCPNCGGFMQHVTTPIYLEKFEPARIGDDLFINDENHDCGKSVFGWDGR